jgi:transposase
MVPAPVRTLPPRDAHGRFVARPGAAPRAPRVPRLLPCSASGRVRSLPSRDARGRFVAFPTTSVPSWYAFCADDMLGQRGYQGSLRTLRDYVSTVRPEPKTEAYLRRETLAGEQAQIDWAHVGRVRVGGGERSLWVFVMVLSYSRALWAELVFDLSVESLCRSLTRAASYFGGVSRQWLFDNPKTVVIERYGDAVRFHPTLLGLCAHFRVQPRLCAVAMPEHKGRVERAIRYLRDRFFAGRYIHSIEQGNQELLTFLAEIAQRRPHPRKEGRTVGEVFDDERPACSRCPTRCRRPSIRGRRPSTRPRSCSSTPICTISAGRWGAGPGAPGWSSARTRSRPG